MVQATGSTSLGEVWMLVRDYKKLARLVLIQGVSHREIAKAVGWSSHSYVGRILRGRISTVSPDAAVRMCHFLQVAVDDFFVTRSSKNPGRNGKNPRVAA